MPSTPRCIVSCPGCNRKLSIAERLAGRWITCPGCRMEFAAITDEVPSDVALEEPAPETRRPPGLVAGVAAVLAFGVLAALVGIMVVRHPADSHDTKSPPQQSKAVDWLPRSGQGDGSVHSADVGSASEATAKAWYRNSVYVLMFAAVIAYVVALILLLAWVARDARNRDIDGGAMWVIVIFFSGIVGILVYLASRPHGTLAMCENCGNRRLNYARLCPHCGR